MYKVIFTSSHDPNADAKGKKGQPSVAKKCSITEATLHSIIYAAVMVSCSSYISSD